jgi:hypothetical protein
LDKLFLAGWESAGSALLKKGRNVSKRFCTFSQKVIGKFPLWLNMLGAIVVLGKFCSTNVIEPPNNVL